MIGRFIHNLEQINASFFSKQLIKTIDKNKQKMEIDIFSQLPNELIILILLNLNLNDITALKLINNKFFKMITLIENDYLIEIHHSHFIVMSIDETITLDMTYLKNVLMHNQINPILIKHGDQIKLYRFVKDKWSIIDLAMIDLFNSIVEVDFPDDTIYGYSEVVKIDQAFLPILKWLTPSDESKEKIFISCKENQALEVYYYDNNKLVEKKLTAIECEDIYQESLLNFLDSSNDPRLLKLLISKCQIYQLSHPMVCVEDFFKANPRFHNEISESLSEDDAESNDNNEENISGEKNKINDQQELLSSTLQKAQTSFIRFADLLVENYKSELRFHRINEINMKQNNCSYFDKYINEHIQVNGENLDYDLIRLGINLSLSLKIITIGLGIYFLIPEAIALSPLAPVSFGLTACCGTLFHAGQRVLRKTQDECEKLKLLDENKQTPKRIIK